MNYNWLHKRVSIEEAAKEIQSGDVIWLSPVCSAPAALMRSITARYQELSNVQVWSALLMQPYDFLQPQYKGHIDYHTIFVGPIERAFYHLGNVHALSASFSHAPQCFAREIHPNVLLVEVSEPNAKGEMSLGPGGVAISALVRETATKIIAQVNPNVPFVSGERHTIHVDECTCICESAAQLPELPVEPVGMVQKEIAKHIVSRISDGATIQLGIGSVSTAIGYELTSKRDLGIHTEMFTDSMMDLMRKGIVTNTRKTLYPGKSIFGFALGSRELYSFLHDNPEIFARPIFDVTNPNEIAKNQKFVSINSGLMVDLTGQVAAESVGVQQISGTGGQLDFVRGATMSEGGQSFIALESTLKKRDVLNSRIVLSLPPGTAVTTPRSDAQYIVTEYGVADLFNKSIEDRVHAMISIAHPHFREELAEQAKKSGLLI